MDGRNEFTIEDLMGAGGALRLDAVPAFEGLRAAFSTKRTLAEGAAAGYEGPVIGEDGRLAEEYVARLCATLGFYYGRLATCRQVHGTTVRRVETAERRCFDRCDGLATDILDAPAAVFTADCVPVVLWAPAAPAFAVIHAGWRGTVGKIVARGVEALAGVWGARPERLAAFLGPAIGPCCYGVGEDVAAAADEAFGKRLGQVLTTRGGKRYFDLHRANELVAQEAGVAPDNIYRVNACTCCEPALFASYRRDGEHAGRMMATAAVGRVEGGAGGSDE